MPHSKAIGEAHATKPFCHSASSVDGGRTKSKTRGLCDQSFPDRIEHDFGRVVKAELLHQVRAVGFNRRDAYFEDARYLLIGAPLGEQLQHLSFSIGQEAIRVLLAALLQVS